MTNKTIKYSQANLNFDCSNYSVLVVEDNPLNLGLIVYCLEDLGFNILIAHDGKSSLELAGEVHPDIILLDVLLPGIDGYQICQRLKTNPKIKDIPVIFMTALSDTNDKVKGFQAGAVDFITKPIQIEEALARIKLHLLLGSMTKTLSQQNKSLTIEIQQRQQAELKLQRQINQRKQTEIQLKKSLKEKEILLKEIHHRVKNNLLVISSLLELQADSIKNQKILKMFEDSQQRIHSMALIHEQLYHSQSLKQLDFADYLYALIDKISESYNQKEAIQFFVETEPTCFNMETAHPCGLIVNELIANSLEHAFPDGKNGSIYISLKRQDSKFVLQVKDDGIGFPAEVNFRETESLGLQLICLLTEQLEGKIELDATQGTCFQITFSELDYCDRL